MDKFARIIETKKAQILITKKFDSESEEYKVIVATCIEGAYVTAELMFPTEETQQETFDKLNVELIKYKLFRGILDL